MISFKIKTSNVLFKFLITISPSLNNLNSISSFWNVERGINNQLDVDEWWRPFADVGRTQELWRVI